jgi:NTE family protein
MKENYSRHSKDHNIPDEQRALVLQGGGALGAYEVGVLNVLCKKLFESSGNKNKNRPLFDIVTGSSMGAINVVNRHKTWKQAVQVLENFWMNEKDGLASTPDYGKWWTDDAKTNAMFSASPEAARRYYSIKEYQKHGTPNVCSGPKPEVDLKFADPDNIGPLHDIDPLQHTIERYSKNTNNKELRIATSWNKSEPRLLVVSVDVAEGKTVTFDSYYKKDHSNNLMYYGDGINIDHIMASGTISAFYKFRKIGRHKFCDGGWLSNTPFRELLQAHRDYWVKVAGNDRDKIPDLEVYIVNVNPSKVDKVPTDYNEVYSRQNDILYLDRNSHYDEMVTYLAADYNELVDISNDFTELLDKLKNLTKSHFKHTSENHKFQRDLEHLLKTTEAKRKRNRWRGEPQKYNDLVKGKFKLNQVVRIERSNDIDPSTGREADYSSKPTDFTYDTIRKLMKQGQEDAIEVLKRF